MKLKAKNLSWQEKFDWIRLARTANIGPATFFRIMEIFDCNTKEAIEKTPHLSENGGLRKGLKICDKSLVEQELQNCENFGAKIITYLDDEYPRMVREIYDPAPILTTIGNTKFLNEDSIAMVGPRNASFHACRFAEDMALDLARREIPVISGLAKGIDSAAHRGSIGYGTAAVIAGGINNIYPFENKDLYQKVKENGVIVSEQPFNAKPRGSNFIQRNRIISGISYGVVVVEAGVQSGSLATARFALDQGREVFAVPGFPADPRTHGSNLLIDEGAIFTLNSEKILKEMRRLRGIFGNSGKFEEEQRKGFDFKPARFPSEKDINKVKEEIERRISYIPFTTEEIINLTQAPARLVNIALVQLELADKISISYGKICKK